MSSFSMFGTCQKCGLCQYMQGQPCRDCGGKVQQGGMRNPLTGPIPEVQKEDPKDARIRQLEQRVRDLEKRLSDASWEASARHAQATGGWL